MTPTERAAVAEAIAALAEASEIARASEVATFEGEAENLSAKIATALASLRAVAPAPADRSGGEYRNPRNVALDQGYGRPNEDARRDGVIEACVTIAKRVKDHYQTLADHEHRKVQKDRLGARMMTALEIENSLRAVAPAPADQRDVPLWAHWSSASAMTDSNIDKQFKIIETRRAELAAELKFRGRAPATKSDAGQQHERNQRSLTTSEEDAILDADPITGPIRARQRRLLGK